MRPPGGGDIAQRLRRGGCRSPNDAAAMPTSPGLKNEVRDRAFIREHRSDIVDAFNSSNVVDVQCKCEMPAAFRIDVTRQSLGF